MRTLHTGPALAVLLLPLAVSAQVIGGPIVNPANGHSYYLLEADSWTNSEAEAVGLGGHLATVDDAAEDAWLYTTFASFGGVDRHLWIGLNDVASEGSFVWTSGAPVSYTNFSAGQPDDSMGVEDYVHISVDSFGGFVEPTRWNDLDDAGASSPTPVHGVVEVVTVPQAPAMPAIGSLATGAALLGVAWHAVRRRLRARSTAVDEAAAIEGRCHTGRVDAAAVRA